MDFAWSLKLEAYLEMKNINFYHKEYFFADQPIPWCSEKHYDLDKIIYGAINTEHAG